MKPVYQRLAMHCNLPKMEHSRAVSTAKLMRVEMFPLFSSISNFLQFLIAGRREEPLIRTLPSAFSSSDISSKLNSNSECVAMLIEFLQKGYLYVFNLRLEIGSTVLKLRKWGVSFHVCNVCQAGRCIKPLLPDDAQDPLNKPITILLQPQPHASLQSLFHWPLYLSHPRQE